MKFPKHILKFMKQNNKKQSRNFDLVYYYYTFTFFCSYFQEKEKRLMGINIFFFVLRKIWKIKISIKIFLELLMRFFKCMEESKVKVKDKKPQKIINMP